MGRIIDAAMRDAEGLASAGFDAIMVENFGDAPFWADSVPPVTVAAMARVVTEITRRFELPIGVNILRNDALASLAVAAITGSRMIRVNVLTGVMYTDQGPITGRAAEVARARQHLAPEVSIYADVFVKHATPPPGLTLEQSAVDTWERGNADALILSGSATGQPVDMLAAKSVRATVPEAPLIIGSGATAESLPDLKNVADAIIVGTSLKVDSNLASPIDPDRARDFVGAARQAGFA